MRKISLTSELEAIKVSKSGIPENDDVCIDFRNKKNNRKTHTYSYKLSHHVDPIVYSSFFLGNLGWSIAYDENCNKYNKEI